MSKRTNKVLHSDTSEVDSESESNSRERHVESRDDNEITSNGKTANKDKLNGKSSVNVKNNDQTKIFAHSITDERSRSPTAFEFDTDAIHASEHSEKMLKRVGKLSRIYRNFKDKLGSLTEWSPQSTDINHRPSSETDDSSDGEKEMELRRVVRFQGDEDAETTPSQIINNLFEHSSEDTVLKTFHQLIHMGEDLNDQEKDNNGQTILHIAVRKNFLSVVEKFLDFGFDPLCYDKESHLPLRIAIRKGYDEMAALIISKLDNFIVRRLFGDNESKASKHGSKVNNQKNNIPDKSGFHHNAKFGTYDKNTVPALFSINELIDFDLDKTLLQVLDSLMEEQRDGQYTVHVKLLDTDNEGREPTHACFDFKCHTAFQDMAKCDKKDALNHPALRTYVEYKWGKWCQRRFISYTLMYLFSLFCWTYSAVTGVTAPDVHIYDTRLQYSRAFFEVIAYLFALATLFTEIRQIVRHKKQYFTQIFNFIELISSILLVLVLPLRYTNERVHWYVFAVGYCFWAMRIFKYSLVFSITGIYAEVIKRIIAQDFLQFSILFVTVNLIFSGTFLLFLKADGDLDTHVDTSSFQGIMYVGLRVLIEAAPVVEYSGTEGYRTAGTIFMIVYMCFTIVALLNILIAQVSETYTRTHEDCVKTVRANRAWTVARAERNEWHVLPRKPNRVKHYTPVIKKVDIKAIEKKETSTMDALSADIGKIQNKQIKDGLEIHTVKTRLGLTTQRLEVKVDNLSKQLEEITSLLLKR